MTDLDRLTELVPPPHDPSPAGDWPADVPADYRALVEQGIEMPYAPADLLPWGIDEAGNVVWWLTQDEWPVVANEARGEGWHRHEGGAVSFLVALLSGAEQSDFLVIEGDDFKPYSSSERPG